MKQDLILWLYVLIGPAVWFASMEANFALAPLAPADQVVLLVISLVALVIMAGSTYLAWTAWRRATKGQAIGSRQALSAGGFWLSGLFFLVILAQAIPNFVPRGGE